MAFSHGKETKVFVGGYDLTTYFRSHSISEEIDMAESSTFGTAAKTYVAGMTDATLSLEGLFDGSVDAVDQVLTAAVSGPTLVSVYPQGDTVGSAGFGVSARESSYEVSSEIGDLAAISAEFQSSVGRERLISHHDMTTEAASGTGPSVDGGAATTNGAVAYLHVPDITGITSLTVKLQDSADNSAWADVAGGAFTAVTADRASERIVISGTIRRYTRAAWTFNGTGTALFAVGLGRR